MTRRVIRAVNGTLSQRRLRQPGPARTNGVQCRYPREWKICVLEGLKPLPPSRQSLPFLLREPRATASWLARAFRCSPQSAWVARLPMGYRAIVWALGTSRPVSWEWRSQSCMQGDRATCSVARRVGVGQLLLDQLRGTTSPDH